MNNKTSSNLNNNQFLAVQMLATGKSGKAIAEVLHVAPETVSRWQQLPQFQSSLSEALDELRRATGKRMIGLITSAIDAIEAGFNDPSISARDRFVMGIKFLELCRKHEIEPKIRDIDEDEDIKKVREMMLEELKEK